MQLLYSAGPMATKKMFELAMSVRDYECDMQGIVNNAVYLNYFEHARHEWLRSRGEDFAALTEAGVILVVVRAELAYRRPLRSGDRFSVVVEPLKISRIRFAFEQAVVSEAQERMVEGRIEVACLNRKGRPAPSAVVDRLFSAL